MFLIIGYGKMGRVYGKHLDELGVRWEYYDPRVPGGRRFDLSDVSHVAITTPTATHVPAYIRVRMEGFEGPVLIEKPVVTERGHLHVLEDPQVWPALCERWNPAWRHFVATTPRADVRRLRFVRMAPGADVLDLGVHDIDLWVAWHGWADNTPDVPPVTWLRGRGILAANALAGREGVTSARWQWPSAGIVDRGVLADLRDGRTITIDLQNQRVGGELCPGGWQWPVKAMLRDFLGGRQWQGGGLSHRLLIDALETEQVGATG